MKNKCFTKEEGKRARRWAKAPSLAGGERYEKDKEYLACVKDILDNPVFQSMDQFKHHGDTTCMAHCIKVSYMSYRICRRLGWDHVQTARAGLLHDLFLYDWHTHAKETGNHFHGFTHPRMALANAEKYFDLTDKEKNMILRHMWPLTPIPPKSREGLAIIYADKFCGLAETSSRVKRRIVYSLRVEKTA